MALSNSFFTLRSGSTKSLTFQQFRGRQVTKDRVSVVANPQTTGQMEQRLKIPMVASARAALKGLVDHSFEGTAYGWQSLQQFSSLNLSKNALDVKAWIPKGAMDTGEANFIVSRGSLAPFSFTSGPSYVNSDTSKGVTTNYDGTSLAGIGFTGLNPDYQLNIAANSPTLAEIEQCILYTLLGTQTTEQLSFLLQCGNTRYSWVNNGTDHSAPRHEFYLYRIDNAHTLAELGLSVIAGDLTAASINCYIPFGEDFTLGCVVDVSGEGTAAEPFHIRLDPIAYSAYENNGYREFCLSYGIALKNKLESAREDVPYLSYAAIIHSRLRDNVWARSTQRLMPVHATDVAYDTVAATYKKGAANSLKFLNNGDDPTYIPGNSGGADAGDTANNDGTNSTSSSSSSTGTKTEG